MSDGPGSPTVRSQLSRWRDRDHTRGRLLTSLLVLCVPLLVSSLAGGVVFQLTDLKLVSGLGEDATTAVVITNQSWRQILFLMVMNMTKMLP